MKIEHIIVAIFSDSVNALKYEFQHAVSLYYASNMNMGILNGNQMGSMGEYFFRVYLYLTIRVA